MKGLNTPLAQLTAKDLARLSTEILTGIDGSSVAQLVKKSGGKLTSEAAEALKTKIKAALADEGGFTTIPGKEPLKTKLPEVPKTTIAGEGVLPSPSPATEGIKQDIKKVADKIAKGETLSTED